MRYGLINARNECLLFRGGGYRARPDRGTAPAVSPPGSATVPPTVGRSRGGKFHPAAYRAPNTDDDFGQLHAGVLMLGSRVKVIISRPRTAAAARPPARNKTTGSRGYANAARLGPAPTDPILPPTRGVLGRANAPPYDRRHRSNSPRGCRGSPPSLRAGRPPCGRDHWATATCARIASVPVRPDVNAPTDFALEV
jgi:hypothetical protein